MILSDLKNNRVLRIRRWDSSAIRIAKSQPTRAGFYQERISMSVIAAIEFDDLIRSEEQSCAAYTPLGLQRYPDCQKSAHPSRLLPGANQHVRDSSHRI